MAFSKFLESRRSACRALIEALGQHFAYASILGTDVRTNRIMVNKNISSMGEGSDCECGFVVKLHNGHAFLECSLDDVSDDTDALVRHILSSVVVPSALADQAITVPTPQDEPLLQSFCRENDYEDYSDEQLLQFCRNLKDDMLARDGEHVLNAIASISTMRTSKLFISKNRELDQSYGWANGFAVVVWRENDKMVQAREVTGYNSLAEIFTELPARVPALIDKAHRLAFAKPITPGVYDVITDPSITGLIAHEAFGHGVEMDQFVKDRALAKQYVGKSVASPICNMRDGAAAVVSAASYFFDDDGVLAQDTQIIKDGILINGLCDLTAAAELGTAPTGNGRRESYKRKAYSRMTNTFFEKGSDKLEDMIASIQHGYMLFETNNGMEDPKNWQIQCTAEYGIEIVDGKLTDNYVSPVVMSGYVPDLLKSISMVSDDFTVFGSGACGKGYKEWVRVSDGGPALKVKVKLA